MMKYLKMRIAYYLIVACSFSGVMLASNSVLVNLVPIHNNGGLTTPFVEALSVACNKVQSFGKTHTIFLINNAVEEAKDEDVNELKTETKDEDVNELISAIDKVGKTLGSYTIYYKSSALGAEGARKELLKLFNTYLEENPEAQQAKDGNRLFWQFLDSDDLVHPDLFNIMFFYANECNARMIHGEFTSRMFDKWSFKDSVLSAPSHGHEEFQVIECTEKGPIPDFGPNGMLMYHGGSINSRGYLPLLFRYEVEAFSNLSKNNCSCDPMYNIMEQYGQYNGEIFILPKNEEALYFYRQHPKSVVHNMDEEWNDEGCILEEVQRIMGAEGQERTFMIRSMCTFDMSTLEGAFLGEAEKLKKNAELILRCLEEIKTEYARLESTFE